jgi:hypothetical protein
VPVVALAVGGIFAVLGALLFRKVLAPYEEMSRFAAEMRADEMNASSGRNWNEETPKSTGESLVRLGEALGRTAETGQDAVLEPVGVHAGVAVGDPARR